MKTRLLLICLLLINTACDFHLRGSQVTEINIANLYIQPSNAPKLTREVQFQLSGAGANLVNSPDNAGYIITLRNENFGKSVLSVSAATGKVEEYRIVYTALLDVRAADGHSIVEGDKVSTSRDFTFDETAVLGKFAEEEVVQEDLVRFAADQVLRRLQALLTKTN